MGQTLYWLASNSEREEGMGETLHGGDGQNSTWGEGGNGRNSILGEGEMGER